MKIAEVKKGFMFETTLEGERRIFVKDENILIDLEDDIQLSLDDSDLQNTECMILNFKEVIEKIQGFNEDVVELIEEEYDIKIIKFPAKETEELNITGVEFEEEEEGEEEGEEEEYYEEEEEEEEEEGEEEGEEEEEEESL